MSDAPGAAPSYSAFLSYSHRDEGHARRLQGWLETYRLPRALRAASPAVDARTGRLRPVFRDRDELTAAPDLSDSVRAAMASSGALIVVCTPAALQSTWVAREIALARALPGARPALAALFAGDSATAFPAGLVTEGPDGPHHPLAADFRPQGDGRRLAVLKLVAAIAGLPLDALIRRDAQRARRRWLAGGATAALVVVTIAVAATLALLARADARAEQARGVATVTALVDQRAALARAGRLDLLQAQDRAALAFFHDRDVELMPASTQLLSARLLQGISEDDDSAGDIAGLGEAAAAAFRTTAPLLAANPADPARRMAHAQSAYWRGLGAWRRGDLLAARRDLVAYAVLAEGLAAQRPRDVGYAREAADANSNLGSLAMRAGDLAEAGRRFRAAQDRVARALRLAPSDPDLLDRLADGDGWLADVERLSGRFDAAWAARQAQRSALGRLQARDPEDAGVAISLVKNQLGLGRVAALQGRWAEADALFDTGRAAALARARADRANADIARQARAFDLFQAASWLDRPAAGRPPPDRLAELIADCAPERARPPADEARAFCALIHARALALAGDVEAARALATATRCAPGYSERWRLDLCHEQAVAISAIGAAGNREFRP